IGHEGLFVGHLRLFHAELLGDDFLDTCFDIAHLVPSEGYRQSVDFNGPGCGVFLGGTGENGLTPRPEKRWAAPSFSRPLGAGLGIAEPWGQYFTCTCRR